MLNFDDYDEIFPLDNNDSEDIIRESVCTEVVSAMAISSGCVVWCTLQNSIYVWDRKYESPLMVGQSDFIVKSICITPEHYVFVADETHIAMYCLSFGEHVFDGPLCALERKFGYAYDFGLVLNLSASPDGSLAALSTSNALVLVDCNSSPPPKPFLEEVESPLIVLSCMEWYNEKGCALTCFASAERLFVLSPSNHLVSLHPDWSSRTVELERDGHVITRAHNVVCMAASSVRDALLVVGLSDGTLKLIQMDTLDIFRTLDLVNLLEKMVTPSALPPQKRQWKACKGRGGFQRVNQPATPAPPSLDYLDFTPGTLFHGFVCDVAVGGRYITASMPDAVLFIDKNSFALDEDRVYFFDENVGIGKPPKPCDDEDMLETPLTTLCADNGCWVSLNAHNNTIQHFLAATSKIYCSPSLVVDNDEKDIVHEAVSLPDKWLTRMSLPCDDEGTKRGKIAPKPVTFGHKVRSAGYTDVPWSVQQKQKKAAAGSRNSKQGFKVGEEPETQVMVPYESHKLTPMSSANRTLAAAGNVHHSAITGAIFSATGQALLTSSSDSSVFNLKYPVAKHNGDGIGLRGHTAAVLGVHTNLSLKTTLVLSNGADATIRIWKPGSRETPFLTHKVPKVNEVRAARFFYTDKFVAYTAGNAVELCKFVLDNGGGDLDRKRNDSCFSAPLVHLGVDAQHITTMECINHFTSPLIVAAGSNKSLSVIDVSSQQFVRVVADAHSRGIHKIAMCTNSRFVHSCPASVEHLFLTAGLDSAVNLWDLRQSKSVRQYALHKNTALTTLGLALSPSGSFFAVGSEDRSVYIYDIKCAGAPLDILSCNDVPTALTWHPVDPVLAVGTSSGTVLLYGQR